MRRRSYTVPTLDKTLASDAGDRPALKRRLSDVDYIDDSVDSPVDLPCNCIWCYPPHIYEDEYMDTVRYLHIEYYSDSTVVEMGKYNQHYDSEYINPDHEDYYFCTVPKSVPDSISALTNLVSLCIEYRDCNKTDEYSAVTISVSALNCLTRMRSLILGNMHLINGEDQYLMLPRLLYLSLDKCRLDRGTTYDIISAVNEYSPDIEAIDIAKMHREVDQYYSKETHTDVVLSDRQLPIDKMIRLKHLNIDKCYLNAALPDSIDRLNSRLEDVFISDSILTGVPDTVLNMNRLQVLCIRERADYLTRVSAAVLEKKTSFGGTAVHLYCYVAVLNEEQ